MVDEWRSLGPEGDRLVGGVPNRMGMSRTELEQDLALAWANVSEDDVVAWRAAGTTVGGPDALACMLETLWNRLNVEHPRPIGKATEATFESWRQAGELLRAAGVPWVSLTGSLNGHYVAGLDGAGAPIGPIVTFGEHLTVRAAVFDAAIDTAASANDEEWSQFEALLQTSCEIGSLAEVLRRELAALCGPRPTRLWRLRRDLRAVIRLCRFAYGVPDAGMGIHGVSPCTENWDPADVLEEVLTDVGQLWSTSFHLDATDPVVALERSGWVDGPVRDVREIADFGEIRAARQEHLDRYAGMVLSELRRTLGEELTLYTSDTLLGTEAGFGCDLHFVAVGARDAIVVVAEEWD